MHATYRVILLIHVLASAVGLLAMVPPLVARKGGKLHARTGRAFGAGMLVSAATGALLAAAWVLAPDTFRPGEAPVDARIRGAFLLLIAALTTNAVVQAVLALDRKHSPGPQVRLRHLWSVGLLVVVALASLVAGIAYGHVLSAIFGLLGLALATRDLAFVLRPLPHRGAYLYQHIQAMGTACISAVTAFFVLGGARVLAPSTLFGGQAWMLWVLPGAALGPLFQYWVRVYRRKLTPRERATRPALDAAEGRA